MLKKLPTWRYEEIKQTVTDMFHECNISTTPISAFEIAIKKGIKVIPYSSRINGSNKELFFKKSKDGFSALKDGEWFIFYNDVLNISYGRINNTLMHEIGHIVLDHTEDSELAEQEVKFFAKYALAPPPLIHNMKCEINVNNIIKIFDISNEAANYALIRYRKWLKAGKDYTDYERKILKLFKEAI